MCRSLFCSLAALACVIAAGPALAKPVEFAPSTPWNADFGDQKCRLARYFGEGEKRHLLFIDQYGPSEEFGLTLAGPAFRRFASRERTALRFFAAQQALRTEPFTGTVEGIGPAVIYSSVNLERGSEDRASDDVPTTLPQLDTGFAGQAEFIGLRQKVDEIRLMTGPLADAFALLNQCTRDLAATWGIDADKHLTATRLPLLTNQDAVVRKIMAGYPKAALNEGQQGIVQMRVIISAQGAVEECTLLNTTEAAALQSPACVAMREASFEPALDMQGEPMRSYYSTTIRYQIGR